MFDDSARPSYAPILYRQVYHPSPLRFTEIRTRGKHAAPFLGYAPAAFYFFPVFFLPLASARRSVFLRRAARFRTLSLPWLFPIRL